MPNLSLRERKRATPISVAINTDYQAEIPGAFFRSLFLKMSGTAAASGAGTNALDGPFGLLGRVEWTLGNQPLIGLQGSDIRHLAAFIAGGHAEILPPSISNGAAYLAQVELPLDRLVPGGGIDARVQDFVARGRFRGLTNLGTTVTAISTGKLRVSGETDDRGADADHLEPRWSQRAVDTATASAELSTTYRVGNDLEVLPAIMIRAFDASAELSDPNSARSDGMVREIRVDVERNGKTTEVLRLTWGEAKLQSTSRYGVNAASGQISTGVVLLTLDDPATPQIDDALILRKGDNVVVRLDTAATVEDEFSALTPGAGDLAMVTFLSHIPKGAGVNRVRRMLAARGL